MSDSESRLFDGLHEAALDSRCWQNVLAPLSGVLGGSSAWLSQQDLATGGGSGFVWGMNPTVQEGYFAHYKNLDMLSLRPGEISAAGPILTDEHRVSKPVLLQSAFYNDFMRPAEAHSILMIDLGVSHAKRSVIHINRPVSHSGFAESEHRRAARLLPHLRRAMQLSHQLGETAQRHADLAAALEALPDAVLLLDRDGCLVHANGIGEAALRAGTEFVISSGKIQTAEPRMTGLLQAAVSRAANADPASRHSATLMLSGRKITVSPIGDSASPPGRAAVMLSFANQAYTGLTVQRLQQMFALTQTEARVALLLLDGHAPRGVAAQLGTQLQTVRNQMRRIFEKTGVARQSELVRLLMSL